MDYSTRKLFGIHGENPQDGEKLFTPEQEEVQAEQQSHENNGKSKWIVLVVDDEEDIHSVTRMSLKGFVHQDKEIQFLHAYSGEEAKVILKDNPDIALILLDVVMENNHAGLDLVKFIRNDLNNYMVQIVLRTGYPGQIPEREAIVSYEINDYKTKTELTAFKLFTVTLASIRAYNSIKQLDDLRRGLEDKVRERTMELEQRNVRIMELDQMKTRFFANISHEIRTPLTLISGPLEDMLIGEKGDERERERFELMYRNSLRILNLVNQLMDLSKIDAGSLKLELVMYNIFKVLKMIARSFSPLAERKNIKYEMDFPGENYLNYFDYDKLEKILTNLLSNAFRFTPEGGSIRCQGLLLEERAGDSIQGLQISVEDTGPGIPRDQQDKIFDRFYQAGGFARETQGGTGIGLSLTRELVDLMHGSLQVVSSERGSLFKVIIPLGKEHLKDKEFEIADTAGLEDFPLGSKVRMPDRGLPAYNTETEAENPDLDRILVIDDNLDIRCHIARTLDDHYEIHEADNGETGVELAKKLIPDLVLLDWMMPGKEGIEVCKILREYELTSHIPIVLLTARAEVKDKVEGLQSGADDYITKPFHGEELVSRVKNLIAQRRKLREKFGIHKDIEPSEVAVNSADEKFLSRARDIIEQNMGDCDFDVNTFYPEMGMSRMQLFRKTKAITNQSPSELIRNYRLKRARSLLDNKFGNIAEITYEVGFNNLSYFAKCFKEKYGLSPSEYMKTGEVEAKQ